MAFGGRVLLSRQSTAQLTVAFFLAAAAVGLPLSWNATVRAKAREAQEARAASRAAAAAAGDAPDEATRTSERLAVELLVNERRRSRGLREVDYGGAAARPAPEDEALFARLVGEHRGALRLAAAAEAAAAEAARRPS